jgi:hypothetical protein
MVLLPFIEPRTLARTGIFDTEVDEKETGKGIDAFANLWRY